MTLRYWEIARILEKDTTPAVTNTTTSAAILPSTDRASHKPSRTLLLAIQWEYMQRAMGILDEAEMNIALKKLGSKLEPLGVFDRDDHPIIWSDGQPLVDFRQDIKGKEPLPEEKEHELYCRIALMIFEDMSGNIIVSRRSSTKSHGGLLEMTWGHVIAGESYLEWAYREVPEETGYIIPEWSLTEADGILKWRSLTPGKDGYKGKGNIVTVFRVKIPDITVLHPDPEEISEFLVFTPEELTTAISTGKLGDKSYEFANHHAYWYLEFLEEQKGINTTEARKKMLENWLMENREKMG